MDRVKDRRRRSTFWLHDAVIDIYAPAMARFPFGGSALAVYAVLARHANAEGTCWPSLGRLEALTGHSKNTLKRCLRLLELLGLIQVAAHHDGSGRQTAHTYTLLEPPAAVPDVPADWRAWPAPAPAGDNPVENGGGGVNGGPLGGSTVDPSPVNGGPLPPSTVDPSIEGLPIMKDDTGKDAASRRQSAKARLLAAALEQAARDPWRPPAISVEQWAARLVRGGQVKLSAAGLGART